MIEKLKNLYKNSTLATKIRYSYLVLLIPIVLLLVFCFYNLWEGNRKYEDMITSTVVASEFSLDFKNDFDYETYLLIVENKTTSESNLDNMLSEANRIVSGLENLTESEDNLDRLSNVKKYLQNLAVYKSRIEENLLIGNKYEDNIQIWENDVQIVTSLVRETIFEYTYYEIRDIQQSYDEYQNVFMRMITFSVVAMIGILIFTILLSYRIPLNITQPILEQVTKEQARLRKAEFELLQSQINPHFLYNTLDAIVWLAESGEQKKVVSMVGSLSDFFRTSLNRGKDIVSIKEELQHVRSYLEIQQVRYQDILNYEINVPEELYSCTIPKITIQPLVENALYHGIKNKRGTGKIIVAGKKENNNCVITIEDNGIGITTERLLEVRDGIEKKVHTGKEIYGLYNVNERIKLNFGDEYGILIESIYGVKTLVTVTLPFTKEENKPIS